MVLLELFLSFFKIGLFSFGGGYAMIPLIQREVITVNPWVTNVEFLDMLAVAQITPGPIAVNTATFVGHRIAGVPGSMVATVAVIMPAFIIVITLSFIVQKMGKSKQVDYIYRGLRPAVLALIFSAMYSIGRESFSDYRALLIGLGSFFLLKYRKLNLLGVIAISALAGILVY